MLLKQILKQMCVPMSDLLLFKLYVVKIIYRFVAIQTFEEENNMYTSIDQSVKKLK